MPGKMKLIYFNVRARAELSRLILAQAGADYDDHRIERADWPELKKTMPAGQLPALEYNGELISQSIAIARFLAREFNLAGKDNWEAAKADMIVDCINDVFEKFGAAYKEKDAEKKAEMEEQYKTETFPAFTKYMEAILVKNGGKHFAGNELTYADIYMAHYILSYGSFAGEAWREEVPALVKLVEDVLDLPNIKKWIKERPVTEM